MASRAILRRRKVISDYLNAETFRFLGYPTRNLESRSYRSNVYHQFESFDVKKLDVERFQFSSPSSVISVSYSVRRASTSTVKQPEPGNDGDRNEKLSTKRRKEASAEECDQAVAGLTTVKAKVKARLQDSKKEVKARLQDSKKGAKSILQRVWAIILGIGPALRAVASMSREDWAKKLVHWKHEIKSTLQHYWLGLKLLWADVRICSRLLLKLAGGRRLSRRERQQLSRTTADIFRLVPFAVFIIIPFMEFLLPVFLKLFPNMLPSTFQDKMKEQEALIRNLHARIGISRFLQDTVKEMAKEVQNSRSGEIKRTAKDLDEFFIRVRRGAGAPNEEILGFAKLFRDDLTLDNISSPFGTDAYLRYMLRKRLRRIQKYDKMIQAEGVESLSEAELREECRERGMLGVLPVEDMRRQLQDWIDLSLNHSVPSSLLILSRAFVVSGKLTSEEAVRATLSSLPDEVVDTIVVTALPSEDPVSERRRRLEYLEMQEKLIKEEERERKKLARKKESKAREEDVALKEMTIPTGREAQEQAIARSLERREQLCEISRALAVLSSASSVSREREEFLGLVNKEIEFYNSMVEKDGVDSEKDASNAYRAAREEVDHDSSSSEMSETDTVSSVLVEKVDSMLQNLGKEIDDVDAKIGDHWRLLDKDHDGKVTAEEVATAAIYLKDTLGKEGLQELISNLAKDKDGKILVEDIVRLGSHVDDDTNSEEESRTN